MCVYCFFNPSKALSVTRYAYCSLLPIRLIERVSLRTTGLLKMISYLLLQDVIKKSTLRLYLSSSVSLYSPLGIKLGLGTNYMFSHWYSIAFPVPTFEFREDDENDRLLLIRNKFPKFTIEIQDDCNLKQLADAFKSLGEFTSKYNQIYGRNKK